jgi:hypothetical protein
MPDLEGDDVRALIDACDTDIGDANLWFNPGGYPDSLTLCIIDSIYSAANPPHPHIFPTARRCSRGLAVAVDRFDRVVVDEGDPAVIQRDGPSP